MYFEVRWRTLNKFFKYKLTSWRTEFTFLEYKFISWRTEYTFLEYKIISRRREYTFLEYKLSSWRTHNIFLEYILIGWRTQNGFSVFLDGTLKNAVHFLGEKIKKVEERRTFLEYNWIIWSTQQFTQLLYLEGRLKYAEHVFGVSRAFALEVQFFYLKNEKTALEVQFFNSKIEVQCSSSSPRTLVNGGTGTAFSNLVRTLTYTRILDLDSTRSRFRVRTRFPTKWTQNRIWKFLTTWEKIKFRLDAIGEHDCVWRL